MSGSNKSSATDEYFNVLLFPSSYSGSASGSWKEKFVNATGRNSPTKNDKKKMLKKTKDTEELATPSDDQINYDAASPISIETSSDDETQPNNNENMKE